MNAYTVTAITNAAMLALAAWWIWLAYRKPTPPAVRPDPALVKLAAQIEALAVEVRQLSADVRAVRAELDRAAEESMVSTSNL